MRKYRPGEVVLVGFLVNILGTFVIQSAAFADTALALRHAQEMELNGQYALAASAYLAMIDGYDFLPGTTTKATILSKQEKLQLGKRAVHCLGKGMKIHIAQHGDLAASAEFHMLRTASHSMKQLEPHNPKWKSLNDLTGSSSASLSRLCLLDHCLDLEMEAEALKAKPTQPKSNKDPLIAHN